jgi:hypothetical protein
MAKKRGLPFMDMGKMDTMYFNVHHGNANQIARELRKKFKDMKFHVRKSSLPGILSDKVSATYKYGDEIDQNRANQIISTIDAILDKEEGNAG